LVKFSKKGYTFEKKCPWNSEGYCAIRQKLSKTKFVVDGLKKSCYNNFGSKTFVSASKSAKRLE
jgi:hypothetical protein